MSHHKFKSEVNQLLDLIIHSLYSHQEIFLRELISNASDALDKLRYLAVSDPSYASFTTEGEIEILLDEKDKSILEIKDNGVGMNESDLKDNLGTIARSGTKKFLSALSDAKKNDVELIGQFGVGFYSSFMVASRIEVISQKAGEDEAWMWSSEGQEKFSITPSSRDGHGTTIRLFLNDAGREFAVRMTIEDLVQRYSNHISFPIYYRSQQKNDVREQLNSGKALWRRSKNDISKEEYDAFFSTLVPTDKEALFHVHTKAEGVQEYITLFFVPQTAPPDMFHADYKSGVKLYIKKVFVSDSKKELLPPYLRFVRGVIDSEDLPLNVSREMLQTSKVLTTIRSSSVKKLLSTFERISHDDPKLYERFINLYNRPLKEGLYSDYGNRDKLLVLVRFFSARHKKYISLDEYKKDISSEDQKLIFYLAGESLQTLQNSPLVAAYLADNKDVLLMHDEIDEVVIPLIGNFEGLSFHAINRRDDVLDSKEKEKK